MHNSWGLHPCPPYEHLDGGKGHHTWSWDGGKKQSLLHHMSPAQLPPEPQKGYLGVTSVAERVPFLSFLHECLDNSRGSHAQS